MTGINILSAQDDIQQHLDSSIPWVVESGGVEDAERIVASNGIQNPFVILRFSDMIRDNRGGSFYGARYDGYSGTVDALCTAANDREARALAAWVTSLLLGYRVEGHGEVYKGFGGGVFSSSATNTVPQYFIATASFRFPVNMVADGTGYNGT